MLPCVFQRNEASCKSKSRSHFQQASGVSPLLFLLGFCWETLNRCCSQKSCIFCVWIVFHPSDRLLSAGISGVSKLESNENLRLTLDSMQMPTVEYREINMDDYSMSQIRSSSSVIGKSKINWKIMYGRRVGSWF